MNKSFKVLFLFNALLTAQSAFSSYYSHIQDVKKTLSEVEKPIKEVVAKAEELFIENNGAILKDNINIISSGTNPYIASLNILTSLNYEVVLTFVGRAGKPYIYEEIEKTNPVAKSLFGTKIILIPIYDAGATMISSWDCLTNADEQAKIFIGDEAASSGNVSFISTNENSSSNEYLSSCIYLSNLNYSVY